MSEEQNAEIEQNKAKLHAIWNKINNRSIWGNVSLEDSKNVLEEWNTKWKKSISPNESNEYYNLVKFFAYEKGGFGSIGGIPRPGTLYGEKNNFKLDEIKDLHKDRVKDYFKIFNDSLTSNNVDQTVNRAKEKKFSAKALLRKMIIMDNCAQGKFEYLCINQDKTIKALCTMFLPKEKFKEEDFFKINSKLLKNAKEIIPPSPNVLNPKQGDTYNPQYLEYHLKLTSALWMLANDEDDFPTAESPNVIFYGAPGTGKTYAVKNYMDFNGIKDLDAEDSQNDQGCYRWVQFHPSFTYEDFIEGLKPTGVADSGSVKLELVNGVFKDFCKQAFNGIKESPEKDIPYYFIVDEINRANLSTVFGETLSLLEPSYRDKILDKEGEEIRNLIDIQYSVLERKASNQSDLFYDSENKGKFGIPRNVRFIGIMNDIDKSIDAFDLALRRRFRWIRKDCDYNVVKNTLLDSEIKEDDINKYIGSCKHLNTYISGLNEKGNPNSEKNSLNLGKSYEFGHSFFLKITEFITNKSITNTAKESLFNNYLCPTLKEYLRSEVSNENDLEKNLKEAKGIFITTDYSHKKKSTEGSN